MSKAATGGRTVELNHLTVMNTSIRAQLITSITVGTLPQTYLRLDALVLFLIAQAEEDHGVWKS